MFSCAYHPFFVGSSDVLPCQCASGNLFSSFLLHVSFELFGGFFWLFHQPKQSLAFFNLICLTIHLCPLSRFLTDGERVCNLTLNPAYKKYAFYGYLWYDNICISNVISTFHFVNIKVMVDILSLPQYLEICESSYCLSFLKKKLTSINQRLSLKFLGSVQSVHAYAYICGMMIWKENHNTTCEYLQYLY